MLNEVMTKSIYIYGATSTGILASDAMKAKATQAAEQIIPYTPYIKMYFGHSISEWASIFSIIGVTVMTAKVIFEIWHTLKYGKGGKNDRRNKS